MNIDTQVGLVLEGAVTRHDDIANSKIEDIFTLDYFRRQLGIFEMELQFPLIAMQWQL